MKESQFGFEYSWEDLRPVRPLTIIVFGAQIVGGAVGAFLHPFPRIFVCLWFGAAILTLPAFLVGLVVQSRVKPGSLRENIVMVRRLGLIAAFLSAMAIGIPYSPFAT